MRSKQIPIVFFFPYRGIGGVSILFLRLAALLSESCRVTLIDYADGYMSTRVPAGVSFLPLEKINEIEANSVVIFQATPAWRIEYLSKIPDECTVFFWTLHPSIQGMLTNHSTSFPRRDHQQFFAIKIKKLRQYMRFLLIETIAFMDTKFNIYRLALNFHLTKLLYCQSNG